MTTGEHLLDLVKDLIDSGAKFIIFDGVAVVLHGVERQSGKAVIGYKAKQHDFKSTDSALIHTGQ